MKQRLIRKKLSAAFRKEISSLMETSTDALQTIVTLPEGESLLDEFLSKPERDVLVLLVRKLSNKNMAGKLCEKPMSA